MKKQPLGFTKTLPGCKAFQEITDYKNCLNGLPETLIDVPASIIPLLGLTQYLRGAVVLTLKHTFLSVGLPSFRFVVTTSVKGPEEESGKSRLEITQKALFQQRLSRS